jgi:hypothetical protein
LRLDALISINTRIVRTQVHLPNRALGRAAEAANEETERGLGEVEDALVEVRFLMRGL